MASYAFRIVNVFAETTPRRQFCACVRGRARAWTTPRCRRWRCNSTCPRPPSCCRPSARRPPCGSSPLATRCVSPVTRRWAPPTWCCDLAKTGDALTLEFARRRGAGDRRRRPPDSTAPHEGAPRTAPAGLPDAEMASCWACSPTIWLARRCGGGYRRRPAAGAAEDARRRAPRRPDSSWFSTRPQSSLGRKTAYVFALDPTRSPARRSCATSSPSRAVAWPATRAPRLGLRANLGGWLLAAGHALPATCEVDQEEQSTAAGWTYENTAGSAWRHAWSRSTAHDRHDPILASRHDHQQRLLCACRPSRIAVMLFAGASLAMKLHLPAPASPRLRGRLAVPACCPPWNSTAATALAPRGDQPGFVQVLDDAHAAAAGPKRQQTNG